MCTNIIVLYIFMILKIVAIVIFPLIIYIKRKDKITRILILIDIIMLAFFIICNVFSINRCVYNSNINGIKRTKNGNQITLYNTLHPPKRTQYSEEGITPNKNLKTYSNTSLYYYNQNEPYMNNAYYECNNNKIYMDSYGSALTSFSIAISTLYDNDINPVKLFNIYRQNNNDLCNNKMELVNVYNTTMKVYGSITMQEISSSEVYDSIRKGGYVIVELSSNEDSKLTCDNGYIVIYNIAKDGKYMIADPSLKKNSYVCPYSSAAYGNIISSDNMNRSWSIEEIDNEAVRYYLVKKG